MAESANGVAALRVVVPHVEPGRAADGFVARDRQHDVRDLMAAGGWPERRRVARCGRRRPVTRHAGDDLDDRLPAADVAFAVIQHAVRSKGGGIELRVVEVQREQVARLQILDLRAGPRRSWYRPRTTHWTPAIRRGSRPLHTPGRSLTDACPCSFGPRCGAEPEYRRSHTRGGSVSRAK